MPPEEQIPAYLSRSYYAKQVLHGSLGGRDGENFREL